MTVPSVNIISDAALVSLREKPDVVVARLLAVGSDQYVVRFWCVKCGAQGRVGNSSCWKCTTPVRDALSRFTVKLADNGVEARGAITFLLSRWNPTLLECRLRDWGSGTQLEIVMKFRISKIEIALFCSLFWLLGTWIFGISDDIYHRLIAISLLIVPLAFLSLRKRHEEELSEFATKHLLEICPGATIERLGNPFK